MKYQASPELPDLERHEFNRVAQTLLNPEVESITLAQLNAAPAKYGDGMVIYADGTNWDPGSGEGVYCYYNAGWNYLG